MNRRMFLQATGLAAVGGLFSRWLGLEPKPRAILPDDTKTKMRTIADIISEIDPKDVPILTEFGKGERMTIEGWPNHKYYWLEDVMVPRTDAMPKWFDYTDYVDEDPFRDDTSPEVW